MTPYLPARSAIDLARGCGLFHSTLLLSQAANYSEPEGRRFRELRSPSGFRWQQIEGDLPALPSLHCPGERGSQLGVGSMEWEFSPPQASSDEPFPRVDCPIRFGCSGRNRRLTAAAPQTRNKLFRRRTRQIGSPATENGRGSLWFLLHGVVLFAEENHS